MSLLRIITTTLLVSTTSVLARTDLAGCTSFATVATAGNGERYATNIWYVPESGELCEILDCGGGRAPPKTNVPGCANYKGTDTYEPRFIDPKTLGQAPVATSTKEVVLTTSATAAAAATKTEEPAAEATTNEAVKSDGGSTAVQSTLMSITTGPVVTKTESEAGAEETKAETTNSVVPTAAAGALVGSAPLGVVAAGFAACIALF